MKSVLVVEDAHADQHLMVSLLEQSGYQVIAKDSTEQAQQWLLQQTNPPDLIIIDIVMPEGKSGLELCRELREEDQFSDIPIIFCSSKDEEFDQFWAMRQGGNAYITKPFLPKEFLNTVAEQVS